jgi:fimbrial chaperone protein
VPSFLPCTAGGLGGRRLLAVLLWGLLGVPALASALSVTPLKLELAPGQRAAALTVRNGGEVEQVFQVTPMAWTQSGGASQYTPTEALLATPRLFRLPPGGSQLVRVGFMDAPSATDVEAAYRIYFEEVPRQDVSGGQLQVLLRVGIPVFTVPESVRDELRWSLRRDADGPRLQAANRGNRHVRVDHWRLTDGEGRVLAEGRNRFYLLAGQQRDWRLQDLPPAGARLQLRAQTGRGLRVKRLDVVDAEAP